ncbi:septum formation initiator family protein [Roseateles sp.]|uniref:septum formation initiator family protein n=1 Tax=Roseateles sp. TaxID=1971397 RepID=UPI003BA7C8D4
MKTISLLLVAFLLAIQGQLWLGKGGLPRGGQLRAELAQIEAENDKSRQRNAQLEAELRDLREGLEMVEEKARFELGMIKPDEIFVQVRR